MNSFSSFLWAAIGGKDGASVSLGGLSVQSETSLNSCFLKGLSVPPKQETFTSEEN